MSTPLHLQNHISYYQDNHHKHHLTPQPTYCSPWLNLKFPSIKMLEVGGSSLHHHQGPPKLQNGRRGPAPGSDTSGSTLFCPPFVPKAPLQAGVPRGKSPNALKGHDEAHTVQHLFQETGRLARDKPKSSASMCLRACSSICRPLSSCPASKSRKCRDASLCPPPENARRHVDLF